jgi:Winged helix DNA-binding domain
LTPGPAPTKAELGRLARIRAARQLLHRPRSHRHPADILRAIGGAQAQDPPWGRLSVRSRHPTLTAADVERARVEERSIVRLWAMRNTAHLVATEDLPFIRPLFAPLMVAFNRRRLAHFGLDANAQDRLLSAIRKHLAHDGELTRTELSDRLERVGTRMNTERRVHIFPLAVSTGIAALGPGDGSDTKLVPAADWLPGLRDLDRDAALAELARRYFAAFGPATEADFAGWAGLPLRDVRAGMAAIGGELREVTALGARAWQPKARSPRPVPADLVRLLPGFDTYLMGHRARDFIAGPDRWPEIGQGGALYPAILVGGAAIGTWRLKRAGRKLEAAVLAFGTLGRNVRAAIEAELDDVARFEGAPVTRV